MIVNGTGDRGFYLRLTQSRNPKIILDASFLKTQHYKVRIKGKVWQSKERSSSPLHLGVIAIEKGTFRSPLTTVANFPFNLLNYKNKMT